MIKWITADVSLDTIIVRPFIQEFPLDEYTNRSARGPVDSSKEFAYALLARHSHHPINSVLIAVIQTFITNAHKTMQIANKHRQTTLAATTAKSVQLPTCNMIKRIGLPKVGGLFVNDYASRYDYSFKVVFLQLKIFSD